MEQIQQPLCQPDLLINLAMRQAFQVMQLPISELAEWVNREVENNPVLQIRDAKPNRSLLPPLEAEIAARDSLYQHLMKQVPLLFNPGEERVLAQLIVGSLNDKGRLDLPLAEVAPSVSIDKLEWVLRRVQQLDPVGVAARDLRESLLVQLLILGKKESLAYQIIDQHCDHLIHRQWALIGQQLGVSSEQVQKTVFQDIAPLDVYPGSGFSSHVAPLALPDVTLYWAHDRWHIQVNRAPLPDLEVVRGYLQEPGIQRYVQGHLSSGRWLLKALQMRAETLYRLVQVLLKRHRAFFEGEGRGQRAPLSMHEVAQELGLHESTIARAVAGKYLACPQGLVALKTFFAQGVTTEDGQGVANHTVKEWIKRAIASEDKRAPLSDQQLCEWLKQRGVLCARRTVTKYRQALHLGAASERRKETGLSIESSEAPAG